mgnify:CR=1 FL=1
MSSNVWVEKYRPRDFNDIVLEPLNKTLFKNIIETSHFPNLLFYGPPGTGKTTTIINLVNLYQLRLKQQNKELMIHLNASDERGIDTIRNQINNFVNSKTLFNNGMKFVILDEVDYMTKNAQQALRYLLQNFSSDVRFCLICNYISRIDEGLQHEFIKIRFNQLPEADIIGFLNNISVNEGLNLSEQSLKSIQKLYNSDIRSMINFMQTNQNIKDNLIKIIDDDIWLSLLNKIKNQEPLNLLVLFVTNISKNYNIDVKKTINDFLNYIIRNHKEILTRDFLNFVENIIHLEDAKNSYYINYSLIKLSKFLNDS